MSVKTCVAAAGIGAVAAYLFDPDRGRGRRARLRDQSRSYTRREARVLERQVHFQRGRVEGFVQRARHRRGTPPADDWALVDRVRTEVLGREPFRPHLTVDAVDGVVSVRGEVPGRESVLEVEQRIWAVPGVVGVHNFLHIPGEPAPNKLDALRAEARYR